MNKLNVKKIGSFLYIGGLNVYKLTKNSEECTILGFYKYRTKVTPVLSRIHK